MRVSHHRKGSLRVLRQGVRLRRSYKTFPKNKSRRIIVLSQQTVYNREFVPQFAALILRALKVHVKNVSQKKIGFEHAF